ncbi:unnamed protein product [Effrenium voratum]|uniref:Uncharacterized protein n=1 Tax=Effrenium voratum TaxID=2562239 RepID=A0AA36MP10_9DINO|nr:unnamed protein product [Effrenium voratum]
MPRLEAAGEGLGAQLAEALLAAKLEDLQRQGVKALPLSVSSCCLQLFPELPAAFAVVNIATCYNFSNLSSVELDVANAQQFLEQLGPGKRPLWAVPVLLRPKTAGLVMDPAPVFTAAFRESGSVRAHLAKACPLTELKHWSLSNSRNEQVTFLNVDAECCAVPGDPSGEARAPPRRRGAGPAPGPRRLASGGRQRRRRSC